MAVPESGDLRSVAIATTAPEATGAMRRNTAFLVLRRDMEKRLREKKKKEEAAATGVGAGDAGGDEDGGDKGREARNNGVCYVDRHREAAVIIGNEQDIKKELKVTCTY